MKPIFQTEFGDGNGNCWAACIASITEIPLEEFPNEPENPFPPIEKVLEKHGWVYFHANYTWYWLRKLKGIPLVATVPSQAHENVDHAIVVVLEAWERSLGGGTEHAMVLKTVHDPNPDNKPYDLAKVKPEEYGMLIRRDSLPRVRP